MIASASIPFSAARDLASLRFFWYQLAYVVIGTMIAMVVYRIPLRFYYQRTHINVVFLMWATAFGLLILTAAFGDVINGSRRWLDLGIFNLQAGEVAKAVMVFVTADYVVRRSAELRSNVFTGVRLLVWYLPVGGLLLFQPDFGTVLVLFATLIVIIFVSGAPALQYAWILFMAMLLMISKVQIFSWHAV
ncbi:Cell division protein FtsW [Moraxella catarrhalis]|nr:Cell division protein FtsW [Moraxella catarrhalis]